MNNPLRTIARSVYWQNLHSRAKELNIKLFNNSSDLGRHQAELLQWLEIYHGIYTDIASGEPLMNDKRIKDDILVDAYIVHKQIQREKEDRDTNRKKGTAKSINYTGDAKVNNLSGMIFRSKRKK